MLHDVLRTDLNAEEQAFVVQFPQVPTPTVAILLCMARMSGVGVSSLGRTMESLMAQIDSQRRLWAE